MNSEKRQSDQLLVHLGYKPLGRTWAKLEIVLGLLAVGVGLFLGDWVLSRPTPDFDWLLTTAALFLFILGGYLALAGHRSHLYQSANETTAYLLKEIHTQKDKGPPA
jgi:hypothetical protein